MQTRRISDSAPENALVNRSLLSEIGQRLRRRVFGLSPREATFERRGFAPTTRTKQTHLENIGYTFLDGYHAGLAVETVDELPERFASLPGERIGFAYEGAAMALTLLDFLTLKTNRVDSRLHQFIAGPGADHIYMIHVGAGWAYARLCRALNAAPRDMDPLLGWLALDGYGFHEGYFNPQKYVVRRETPARITGRAREVFDQGLGRSLWFVQGANVQNVAACIATFPERRQADLWSGIGLACAYAGGSDKGELEILRELVGDTYRTHIQQGVSFAAKARLRAKNMMESTERACRILCDMSADDAARITDQALTDLPQDGKEPAYWAWRRRIREGF